MQKKHQDIIAAKCCHGHLNKLVQLANPKLDEFIAGYIELCNPDSIYVCDDSDTDRMYIRNNAIEDREEKKLTLEGILYILTGTWIRPETRQTRNISCLQAWNWARKSTVLTKRKECVR